MSAWLNHLKLRVHHLQRGKPLEGDAAKVALVRALYAKDNRLSAIYDKPAYLRRARVATVS